MSKLTSVIDLVNSLIRDRRANFININESSLPPGVYQSSGNTSALFMLSQEITDLLMILDQLERINASDEATGDNQAVLNSNPGLTNTHRQRSYVDWDCDHQNMGKGSGEIQSRFGI
jgi:hypothetical protein